MQWLLIPLECLLFGRELTLFGFIPAFMVSSFTGATDRNYFAENNDEK